MLVREYGTIKFKFLQRKALYSPCDRKRKRVWAEYEVKNTRWIFRRFAGRESRIETGPSFNHCRRSVIFLRKNPIRKGPRSSKSVRVQNFGNRSKPPPPPELSRYLPRPLADRQTPGKKKPNGNLTGVVHTKVR